MNSGFVKFPRWVFRHPVFTIPELWHLFSYLVCHASWRNEVVMVKGPRGIRSVELIPGQYILHRHFVAADLKITEDILDSRIRKLRDVLKLLTTQKTNFGIIITVLEWRNYSGFGDILNNCHSGCYSEKDDTFNEINPDINEDMNANVKENVNTDVKQDITEEKERSKEKEYNTRKQEIISHTAPAHVRKLRIAMAEKLYALYPKKYGYNIAVKTILSAIENSESADEEIFYDMLEAVIAYGMVTRHWIDKNQIMRAEKFFSEGHYHDDWSTWLPRDRYGKTLDGSSWDETEIQTVKQQAREVINGFRR